MAHYLVTGGAGFIGSHLAEELVRRGEQVRIVDSLITGKRQNLAHLPSVEFIQGDLADLEVARRAVAGVDYVLHQAAIPSVPRSVTDPINLESRQHRRVAERPGRGPRRRGEACRVCRFFVSLWQYTDTAQGRNHADGTALALCASETGGRAVLPDVHAFIRA
jgi:NAD(P)-dependent dehydrogenase (short-subunit alcohol dehydrogenase family)